MPSDLPWTQEPLPVIERQTGYSRLDLHGPHDLMACGFKTKAAADSYIARTFTGGDRDPVLGPMEGPDGIHLASHRVGRGWCCVRYPRWELSYDHPFDDPDEA